LNPKVAVVQMDCKLGEMARNVATIKKFAKLASRRDADIVCYPELATTGYSLNRKWRNHAETIPGPTSNLLAKLAEEFGFYLICGMVERDSRSNRIFDSTVLINPSGDLVGVYRKVHLWDMERRFFTPGKSFPVFRTKFGNVGLGICYDLEFPEPARALAVRGADIIFFSSAQPSWMRKLVDTYVHSRASENCLFVAHSNRVGREGGLVFLGQSQIVSPYGHTLAKKNRGEGVVVARVDFSIRRRMRRRLPYLRHRIPRAYSTLTG